MLISYQNRIDTSVFGAYGSWQAALPLTNLQSRTLSKVARSTNAANTSTRLRFTLDTARVISAVSIINHNLSTTAQYRYRVFSDSAYTTIEYDSGLINAWSTAAFGAYEWEDLRFWDLTITDDDKALFTKTLTHIPTTLVSEMYYQIEFFDVSNPDGYVELGRIFVGAVYQPVINMSLGASISYENTTLIDSSMSGAEYFDRRDSYRVARFTLDNLSDSEAIFNNDLQKISGTDAEVLYIWNPSDTENLQRRAFLGRIRSLSAIEQPYSNMFRTGYEIKELL